MNVKSFKQIEDECAKEAGVDPVSVRTGLKSPELDLCRENIVCELRRNGRTYQQIVNLTKLKRNRIMEICQRRGVVLEKKPDTDRVSVVRHGFDVDSYIDSVCRKHSQSREQVIPSSPNRRIRWIELMRCRYEICAHLRYKQFWPLVKIAEIMNYKDHTTVSSLLKNKNYQTVGDLNRE